MNIFTVVFVVCAAVLASTQGQPVSRIAPAPAVQPYCTDDERSLIIRNCVMAFRFHHRRYLRFLQSQPSCRPEVFNCERADDMVRCLNTQPVSSVSNRCWAMVPSVITYLLKDVNYIPCTFEEISDHCRSSTTLLAANRRPQTGEGMRDSFMPGGFGGGGFRPGFGGGFGPAFGGGFGPAFGGGLPPMLARVFARRRAEAEAQAQADQTASASPNGTASADSGPGPSRPSESERRFWTNIWRPVGAMVQGFTQGFMDAAGRVVQDTANRFIGQTGSTGRSSGGSRSSGTAP